MKLDLREVLEGLLREHAGDWSEPERDRARAVAGDLVILLARKLSGDEDADAELAHARAAAASIASERAQNAKTLLHLAAVRLADQVRHWLLASL